MTLVQNLQRPLSGNKALLFLVIALFGMSSCDMFRKAQTNDDVVAEEKTELDEVRGPGVYNPETGEYEPSTTISSDVDTVKWTTNEEQIPPISSEATDIENPNGQNGNPLGTKDGPSQKMGSYNVSVMLPFFTNRFGDGANVDQASLQAVNFYGGMKIAFEDLQKQGVDIQATVHDTKGSETATTTLMSNPDVTNSDLIIGPFRKNNIKIAAEKAKVLQTPFVSPLSASSNVTKDNPYFIQVSPYLKTHCQAITRHAKEKYSSSQIVLVARNKKAEISRFDYFQDENKKLQGNDNAERFQEYIISTTGEEMNFDEIDVSPYLKEGETTVFIVPSFSNKNFIYGLMLQIYNTKGQHDVVIYGMPQWMDFEPPSFDYYELLNLHVSSASFADPESTEVKDFRQRYFNRYGTIPNDKAFSGYDIMMYFGKMIDKHGTKFQEKIDSEREGHLNTTFEFVREVPLSAALQEDFTKTNLYENKHVYILKFEDYGFKLAE